MAIWRIEIRNPWCSRITQSPFLPSQVIHILNKSSWLFPSTIPGEVIKMCVEILPKNQFWHTTGETHNGAGSQKTSSWTCNRQLHCEHSSRSILLPPPLNPAWQRARSAVQSWSATKGHFIGAISLKRNSRHHEEQCSK